MKIAILGAGAWGSALAIALSRAHAITLWTRVEDLHRAHDLPGLGEALIAEAGVVLARAQAAFFAIVRERRARFSPAGPAADAPGCACCAGDPPA